MTLAVLVACYCMAILVVSLVGGLVPLLPGLTHTRVQLYLSFSAGTMLGAAFFHMLPDAAGLLADHESLFLWVACGLLGLFFLERFFAFHHHEVPEASEEGGGETTTVTRRHGEAGIIEHCDAETHASADVEIGDRGDPQAVSKPRGQAAAGGSRGGAGNVRPGGFGPHPHRLREKSSALVWGAAAVGLSIHTLVGGVALASAVAAGAGDGSGGLPGLGVFLATLLHKPADALTIVTLMVSAGGNRRRAVTVNSMFSLVVPLGVGLFYLSREFLARGLESQFTGAALAFSAGTFLCIALSDLLPELQFHEHDRVTLSLALLAGLALMFVTAHLGG